MGTLGFLLPFRAFRSYTLFNSFSSQVLDIDDFVKALESVFSGKATILNRMRLACMFYNQDFSRKSQDVDGKELPLMGENLHVVSDWQVMNEIALHRGSSPHLNTIDIFVDGQHLTEAVVRPLVLREN